MDGVLVLQVLVLDDVMLIIQLTIMIVILLLAIDPNVIVLCHNCSILEVLFLHAERQL